MLGTNCPIPPNTNWTYKFQTKDQIGTFTYFPSTKMHRTAGGFGGFNVNQRSVIFVPYHIPDGEFTLLVGDWYKAGHKVFIYFYNKKNQDKLLQYITHTQFFIFFYFNY